MQGGRIMPHGLAAILESTEPTFLATGLGATEGPLWHPAGYVIFVDHRGSRALRWDADTGVSVVREQTGEGNGCALDRQGRAADRIVRGMRRGDMRLLIGRDALPI